MRSNLNMRSNLVFLALILFPFASYGEEVVCPEFIETNQVLATPVQGFVPFLRQGHAKTVALNNRVAGVELYSGDPNDLAELVPDNVDDNDFPKGGVQWSLDPASQDKYPIYVSCTYSQTVVRLVKMVRTKVNACKYNLPTHDAPTKVVCT